MGITWTVWQTREASWPTRNNDHIKVILRCRECQKRRTWPLVVKAGDGNDVLCSPLGNLIHDLFDICCGIQKTFQSRFYFVH
uniref:Uncharacterized protein n=1 Tax=Caenorhabditis japonica TaxID=281687 RepID=A0A2Q4TDW6_CAEJA